MRIAICDDVKEDLNLLKQNIIKYAKLKFIDFQIDEFSNGQELLSAYQKKAYPILFLDIYLNDLSGIDIAYKIRKASQNSRIIFTTTSQDFRAEGFDLNATHYLVKPITFKKLEDALNRCAILFCGSEKYLPVIVNREKINLLFRNILYIEVYGKTCSIHTHNRIYNAYTTLSKIEEKLSSGPFLRCHRCYIVNMNFIDRIIDKNFQLTNGEMVPIRKNGTQNIKDKYGKYLLNSLRESETVYV